MRLPLILFSTFAVLTCLAARAWAADPSATLSISGEAIQPSDVPVVFTLTITNTGAVPISYWCGGPADYPDASDFRASVHRLTQPETNVALNFSNGQISGGAGRLRPVLPGQIVQFPAALDPLPPGKYVIKVRCDADGHFENNVLRNTTWPAIESRQGIEIEIRDDPNLRARCDEKLLAQVRAGNSFGGHLAVKCPRPLIRAGLVQDLISPETIVVERAIDGLWGSQQPPFEDGPLVIKTINAHLNPAHDDDDSVLMTRLLEYATHLRKVTTLEAQIKVAAARPTGRIHAIAMDGMTHMRNWLLAQPKPKDYVPPPASQYDADAIQSLIKLTKSKTTSDCVMAYLLLSNYPDSPAATAAVLAGTTDPNGDVRAAAQMSLDRITP